MGANGLLGKVYSKADSENWRQCWECHEIVPIYELKKESKLKDLVDTTDNPFDAGKSIVGLGNKRPKDRYQKERETLSENRKRERFRYQSRTIEGKYCRQ